MRTTPFIIIIIIIIIIITKFVKLTNLSKLESETQGGKHSQTRRRGNFWD